MLFSYLLCLKEVSGDGKSRAGNSTGNVLLTFNTETAICDTFSVSKGSMQLPSQELLGQNLSLESKQRKPLFPTNLKSVVQGKYLPSED